MANVSNTSYYKLVSQFDNAGIQVAMKDMEKFEANWMKILNYKQNRMDAGPAGSPFASSALSKSFAEEEANRQKALDREVWAARARLRDEDVRKEVVAGEARRKTESILAQARVLSSDSIAKAEAQRHARAQSDAQVEAALEKKRHDQVMNDLLTESGGRRFGNTAADNNSRNRGFQGARELQQVGFGLQDFMSQLQNAKTSAEGVSRGIMAISNNVQMLGSSFGPTGLAVTAIGGAIVGTIGPAVVNWLADTKKLEEHNKQVEASYERMGTLVKGLQSGNLLNTGPMNNAEKAKASIDDLTNRITAASVTSNMLKKKIEEEMQTGGNTTEIEAFRKHQVELTEEIRKAEMERAAIQEIWGRSKLEKALKAIEDEKKAKKAAEIEEQDGEKALAAAINQMKEEARAEDDKIRRQYDVRQAELRNQIQDLQANAMTPNGSSSASVRGTSAATSAINRAISGSNSVEGDNKRKIKLLEDQLRALERLEQKMNFKRAGLSA